MKKSRHKRPVVIRDELNGYEREIEEKVISRYHSIIQNLFTMFDSLFRSPRCKKYDSQIKIYFFKYPGGTVRQ